MSDSVRKYDLYDVDPKVFQPIRGRGIVEMWNLFSEEVRQALYKNHIEENHGKNHIPLVCLTVRKLGYKFLLTEIDSLKPEYGFGLYEYDTELGIGYVHLPSLYISAENTEEPMLLNREFYGKYSLAVYAMVANKIGLVITDDSVSGYSEIFQQFTNETSCDPSLQIDSLASKLPFVSINISKPE